MSPFCVEQMAGLASQKKYFGTMSYQYQHRLTLFLLPLLLASCLAGPQDATIEAHFNRHKAEFEELVLMMEAAVRSEGLYRYDDYLETQPRYTELLRTVEADKHSPFVRAQSSSAVTPKSSEEQRLASLYRPKAIYFVLDRQTGLLSGSFFGTAKGIVFFLSPPSPEDVSTLVPDTQISMPASADDQRYLFHRINKHWYIFRILYS